MVEVLSQADVLFILPGGSQRASGVLYMVQYYSFILFLPLLVIKHGALCMLASTTPPLLVIKHGALCMLASATPLFVCALVTLTLPEACPSHPCQELPVSHGTHCFAGALSELG